MNKETLLEFKTLLKSNNSFRKMIKDYFSKIELIKY